MHTDCRSLLRGPYWNSFSKLQVSWHFTCDNSATEKRGRNVDIEKLGLRKMTTNKRNRWSKHVTEESKALDLEQGVFSKDDPRSIARSLKRSADRSRRRKSDPFRSAMSMLTFYINRAGKTLSKSRLKRLEAAKEELRDLYGRPHKRA
jgi:hypothetical protein